MKLKSITRYELKTNFKYIITIQVTTSLSVTFYT